MTRALAPFFLLLIACSITLDGGAPAIALTDTPALPSLRIVLPTTTSLSSLQIITGADGAPWLVLRDGGSARLLPLDGGDEVDVAADSMVVSHDTLYLGTNNADTVTMRLFRPGRDGPNPALLLPSGSDLLAAPAGDKWLYHGYKTTSYQLLDGNGATLANFPGATNGQSFGSIPFLGWSAAGDRFFTLCSASEPDRCDRIIEHSTSGAPDLDLAPLNGQMSVDDDHQAVTVCDDTGLRSVPWDSSPAKILDPDPCTGLGIPIFDAGDVFSPSLVFHAFGRAFYRATHDGLISYRAALTDGSAPSDDLGVNPPDRALAAGPGVAARAVDTTSFAHATDGWIGTTQFMQRGRAVHFSRDQRRVRWLEGTARVVPSGTLLSMPLAGGAPTTLALNVSRYLELTNGRLLAIADADFDGSQNQLVLLDEDRLAGQVIADGADDFLQIPGTNDLLARLVTGEANAQLVRLPIPPAPAN